VLIARVESEHPLSYILPVGERLPLHIGGAGKIFLAEMTDEGIDASLSGVGSVRHASGNTVSIDDLKKTLAQIKKHDYAVSVGERTIGISSVMAPVRAADGTLLAVLGVTGPTDSIDTNTQTALIAEVRRAAAALGTRAPVTR